MLLYSFVLLIVVTFVFAHLNGGLESSLDFGLKNKVSDMNFLLGVAVARDQLGVMKTKEKNNSETAELQILREKCDNLINLVTNKEDPLALALSADLWSQDCPLHSLSPPLQQPPSYELTEAGPLSDDCLRLLLSHCYLPLRCLSAELSDRAVGYTLTHQLLYWTLASQVCYKDEFNKMMVKSLIKHKCRKVYGERLGILALGLPQDLRDLYFEQVVVCGLHGYHNFLSHSDKDFLLSLQTPDGSFAPQQRGYVQKSDSHLSGVAVAALSLLAKYQLDLTDE